MAALSAHEGGDPPGRPGGLDLGAGASGSQVSGIPALHGAHEVDLEEAATELRIGLEPVLRGEKSGGDDDGVDSAERRDRAVERRAEAVRKLEIAVPVRDRSRLRGAALLAQAFKAARADGVVFEENGFVTGD